MTMLTAGRRLCGRIIGLSSVVSRRWLTQNETSTALRPFYFAVHPDLFTLHPKERLINEESLKILNSHVESLLNNQEPLQSKRLSFYVRDQRGAPSTAVTGGVRPVTILLESGNLRSLISGILQSCGLSTEYVDGLKVKAKPKPESVEGTIPNPEVAQRRPPKYLSTWLRRNIGRARQLDAAATLVFEETERLRGLLRNELNIADVRWASNWGLQNYVSCLKRFYAMAEDQNDEPWAEGLAGRTLVFGSETGVTSLGEIILSSDDVPRDWLSLLNNVKRYDHCLQQLPELEAQLSSMLNGIAIVRRCDQTPVMADRYWRHLQQLIQSLQNDIQARVTGDLSHLQLCVECAAGPLTVSPRGQILVPCSCPGPVARNFIQQTKLSAAKAMSQYLKSRTEEEMIMNECRHALNLRSLIRDETLSSAQVCQSCMRMMHDVRQVGVSLAGLSLRISQFYTVMSSGEIVIPWDWKGHVD